MNGGLLELEPFEGWIYGWEGVHLAHRHWPGPGKGQARDCSGPQHDWWLALGSGTKDGMTGKLGRMAVWGPMSLLLLPHGFDRGDVFAGLGFLWTEGPEASSWSSAAESWQDRGSKSMLCIEDDLTLCDHRIEASFGIVGERMAHHLLAYAFAGMNPLLRDALEAAWSDFQMVIGYDRAWERAWDDRDFEPGVQSLWV